MGNSLLMAQIIGPYCLIVGVGILANRAHYDKMIDSFLKNEALLYLGGIIALLLGLIVVLTHNVWSAGWPAVITGFGWLGIIKGSWLLVFPASVSKCMKSYQKNSLLLVVQLIIVLLIGLGLTVFGYAGK